jgi:STE24 endopeptidase
MSEIIYWLIIGILLLGFALDQGLNYLSDKGWSNPLPSFVKPDYSDDKYAKAKDYHKVGGRLSIIKSLISLLVIISIISFGGFSFLDKYVASISDSPTLQMLLFFGIIFILSDIFSLPFQLYSTFSIEERFGFNKTSIATFFLDKVKSWVLLIVIGGGLLVLIYKIYEVAQDYFWILAWAILSVFSLFMAVFYTKLLLPLFNKLTPLEDGELKDSIEKVASDTGFTLEKVLIMDGSKRSAKANAFFSGLGKQKSIILYDTLVEQHTTKELLAVLAHEIGHYKLKHIPKSIILGLVQSFMTFFILGVFLNYPIFSEAIGFSKPSFYASLIAFGMLYSPIEVILGMLSNAFSRKNEYEADNFAKNLNLGEELTHALIKMSAHHLSNLYPHPLDVKINYSHPTLIQRVSHLKL